LSLSKIILRSFHHLNETLNNSRTNKLTLIYNAPWLKIKSQGSTQNVEPAIGLTLKHNLNQNFAKGGRENCFLLDKESLRSLLLLFCQDWGKERSLSGKISQDRNIFSDNSENTKWTISSTFSGPNASLRLKKESWALEVLKCFSVFSFLVVEVSWNISSLSKTKSCFQLIRESLQKEWRGKKKNEWKFEISNL